MGTGVGGSVESMVGVSSGFLVIFNCLRERKGKTQREEERGKETERGRNTERGRDTHSTQRQRETERRNIKIIVIKQMFSPNPA